MIKKKKIQRISRSGVWYTDRRPIRRDGMVVGYRLYDRSGYFGMLRFRGYQWLK